MRAIQSSRTKTALDELAETVVPGIARSFRSVGASKPGPLRGGPLPAGPEVPAGTTTKSAVTRSRVSPALAASSVAVAPSREPVRATMTSTGAATAAVRRTPAAAFSRTSMPPAPGSRAGSQVSSRVDGRTRTGASSATAVISSMGRLT